MRAALARLGSLASLRLRDLTSSVLRRTPKAARPLTAQGHAPALPMGQRIYAIGDVHGRLDLLLEMEARIAREAQDRRHEVSILVLYLGDYVDRGPDSRGVVERLLRPPPEGVGRLCLLGNHDVWMREALAGEADLPHWLSSGGDATLRSYGVVLDPGARRELGTRAGDAAVLEAFGGAVPGTHRAFLASLTTSFMAGDYMFCHAGVAPDRPLDRQMPEDLVWIREPFLSFAGVLPRVVVHGHTRVRRPEIRRHRIGIDTGAFRTGRLTALVLEGPQMRFLTVEGGAA